MGTRLGWPFGSHANERGYVQWRVSQPDSVDGAVHRRSREANGSSVEVEASFSVDRYYDGEQVHTFEFPGSTPPTVMQVVGRLGWAIRTGCRFTDGASIS